MSTIEQRVRAVIAAELGTDEHSIATNDSLAVDLGADSSDRLSLTMALEDEFGIEISDEDAQRLTTVREIIAYIQRLDGTAAIA